MDKKTILYVGGFELPDKNAAAHRVLNNGKIFRELGYNVVFLGISHSENKLVKESFHGFECWSMPYPKNSKQWLKYLSSIDKLKFVLEQQKNIVGIVFYNYQSGALRNGLNYCKKHKLWSIVDITEWYMPSKSNLIFYLLKKSDTVARMRILNKRADGIISISKFLSEYYKKCGCTNLIQLPPLIDKLEEKWNVAETYEEKNKIQLIYAGSSGDIKDKLNLVLSNLVEYKDFFEINILGITEEAYKRQFSDKCLGDHVVFHGRVSHEECIKQISKSDFQIFIRENNLVTKAGFPTKFGESLACGTPVITNLTSNLSEYLEDGKNGYIVEDISDEGIKKVLKKISLLTHDDIKTMKDYAREYSRFDYRNYIEDVSAYLESITRGR